MAICRRVAETAENWADCSDMKEALAAFKELGRDCRKLLEVAGAQLDAERPAEKCECEKPGYFCSGIAGILARVEEGKLAPNAKLQRCDLCRRYPTDEAARARLVELGIAPGPTKRLQYVLYDLDADALASTTIYHSYREAADGANQLNDVLVLPFALDRSQQDEENPP